MDEESQAGTVLSSNVEERMRMGQAETALREDVKEWMRRVKLEQC